MSDFKNIFFYESDFSFKFLINEYGFTVNSNSYSNNSEWYSILYEKQNGQFVEIFYAPFRYELDLILGIDSSIISGGKRITLYEYLSVFKPQIKLDVCMASSKPEELQKQIQCLAKYLLEYCNRFMENDTNIWSEISNFYKEQAINNEIRQTRSIAEKAFNNKEWNKCIKLYKNIESNLTEIDKKRLSIAQKQDKFIKG